MGIVLCALALWILPVVFPLFFLAGVPRKIVFYFVGLACSFFCFKLSPFFWGFFSCFIGMLVAWWRHEDMIHGIQYGFKIVAPGLSGGSLALALIPDLAIGSIFSLIVLRVLKSVLFKPAAGATRPVNGGLN